MEEPVSKQGRGRGGGREGEEVKQMSRAGVEQEGEREVQQEEVVKVVWGQDKGGEGGEGVRD